MSAREDVQQLIAEAWQSSGAVVWKPERLENQIETGGYWA